MSSSAFTFECFPFSSGETIVTQVRDDDDDDTFKYVMADDVTADDVTI